MLLVLVISDNAYRSHIHTINSIIVDLKLIHAKRSPKGTSINQLKFEILGDNCYR